MDSTDRSTSSFGQYKWFSVGRLTWVICLIVAFSNHGTPPADRLPEAQIPPGSTSPEAATAGGPAQATRR
jgi:hypothetical protein